MPAESVLTQLKRVGVVTGHVFTYHSVSAARNVCYGHSTKPMRIILGDYPEYWVVGPADAERLLRAGYEPVS